MASAPALSAQEKIALIHTQLQEVLRPEIIEDVIVKQNRSLIIYWGSVSFVQSFFPPQRPAPF